VADILRTERAQLGGLHRGDIDELILGCVTRRLSCFALGVSCQELLDRIARVALDARIGTEQVRLTYKYAFDGVGQCFVVLWLDGKGAEIEYQISPTRICIA